MLKETGIQAAIVGMLPLEYTPSNTGGHASASRCSGLGCKSSACVPLQILTDSASTHHLKLTNDTETPLSFKLVLAMPFSVTGVDPKKSLKTSHSDKEEGENHILLCALQNILVG